jgi:hypothetical protein
MSHHVPTPWVMGYDIEPAVTTKYKKEFYDFIIDKDLTMIFEHDNDNWGAKIIDSQKYGLDKNLSDKSKSIEI